MLEIKITIIFLCVALLVTIARVSSLERRLFFLEKENLKNKIKETEDNKERTGNKEN